MPSAVRSKTILLASFWIAALFVGVAAVLFEHLISFAQNWYFRFYAENKVFVSLATPLLFLISVALVRLIAPTAKGSGIPQALKATMLSLGSYKTAVKSQLVSIRAAGIKVVSTTLGILAGASIGREGPTVQISTAIFAWIGARTKKFFPQADFHSYLVAGSAAGVAAAFNTPLAGITFALEEIAEGSFAQIKQTVMVSVILAGITTQVLVGNYLYFGHPVLEDPGFQVILPAVLIGLIGGLLGGLFAKLLALNLFEKWKLTWWHKALLCGAIVGGVNFLTASQSAGTGYEFSQKIMDSTAGELGPQVWITLGKLVTTVFSFLSGMAGGIFSPSLAIGAGIGSSFAQFTELGGIQVCALLGMAAFFTGAVQAPLTAVIIVMEMTDLHSLILPLMMAAFVAQGISKIIMPVSIYRTLANRQN